MKKLSPFDYINSISSDSKNQIIEGEMPPEEYNAFIINRGLSLYQDTILLAQEMNIRPDIPKASQYHFLHTLVSKRKRWSKWPKKTVEKGNERLFEVLVKHEKYSLDKALDIIKLLSDEEKKIVVHSYDEGQKIKKKSTKEKKDA